MPDDPTLLFTNAGMVQFKKAFLGVEKKNYSRAATVQKCMRVSGKHNDLENVGPSPRHNTFFEMLGNFSFGAYFKREAIHYAWELLTKVYGLPKDRFHFTVYRDDEESFKLWQEIAGVPKERIHRLGEKTNFWMMGETGPCGPNSELLWDRGLTHCDCGCPDCSPALDNDCNRWLEVWNLVFMEFNQDDSGKRALLPKPGVDTGMGLERIVAVLQNASTIFETDLFQPIFQKTRQLLKHSEEQMRAQYVPYRVLADHGRAMTFLLAEGVMPSNEKHGYVLRMVMRRAIRFGKKLSFKDPFLGEISKTVIEQMGGHYRELNERKDSILKAIAQEEERFERTLDEGLVRLSELMTGLEKQKQKVIPGSEAFKLHDTFGFPFELTMDVARERAFSVDRAGYEQEMEKQRERSRKKLPLTVITESGFKETLKEINSPDIQSEFTGYNELVSEAELKWIDPHLKNAIEHDMINMPGVNRGSFIFDQTPFYAEGGGQVADTGDIENLDRLGEAEIINVQRDKRGVCLHEIKVKQGAFAIGDQCRLKVNMHLRRSTQRNHTATHILHAALRQVLGYSQGIQAGSLVAPFELRFDFKHFAPLRKDEIDLVEARTNDVILDNLPVLVSFENLEDAKARGAMALFNEDYQGKEKVRVVQIGNEKPFSIELCGGTHVSRTGEIGGFKIIGEEGVAAGVRRVHVAVGEKLIAQFGEKENQLRQLAQMLKSTEKELLTRVETLLKERDQLSKELDSLKREWLSIKKDSLFSQKQSINGTTLVCARLDLSMDDLKMMADLLEPQIESGVIILGGTNKGKVALVSKVTAQLIKKFHAGEIVKTMTSIVKGGGGGSPRFAQGGGTDPTKLDDALKAGEAWVREKAQL
ncbi:alanine--tRNA ligase [Candidatus Acetothermia bacterium]|nr:alanine--tRNA ligase [Candidatus Acetothermia bacterium]